MDKNYMEFLRWVFLIIIIGMLMGFGYCMIGPVDSQASHDGDGAVHCPGMLMHSHPPEGHSYTLIPEGYEQYEGYVHCHEVDTPSNSITSTPISTPTMAPTYTPTPTPEPVVTPEPTPTPTISTSTPTPTVQVTPTKEVVKQESGGRDITPTPAPLAGRFYTFEVSSIPCEKLYTPSLYSHCQHRVDEDDDFWTPYNPPTNLVCSDNDWLNVGYCYH